MDLQPHFSCMNDGEQTGPRQEMGNYHNLRFLNVVGCKYVCDSILSPMRATRIGEAKNPGPFEVSCLNIQSINAAVNESRLKMPTHGILALSETCATKVALDKANKYASARKCHAFHSGPSRYRNDASGVRSEARLKPLGRGWLPRCMQDLCKENGQQRYGKCLAHVMP